MVANMPQNETELPEPVFRIPFGTYQLSLPEADPMLRTHLARRVAAFPNDLLAHTRRIFAAKSCGDAGEVVAGLADLFLATGQRCLSLRKHLLSLSAPLLSADDRHMFEQCLSRPADGILPSVSAGCMLHTGLIGRLDIVRKRDDKLTDSLPEE